MSETVTITGITGHDAGMTGHIDRNQYRALNQAAVMMPADRGSCQGNPKIGRAHV